MDMEEFTQGTQDRSSQESANFVNKDADLDEISYCEASTQALTTQLDAEVEFERSVISESPELNLQIVASPHDDEENIAQESLGLVMSPASDVEHNDDDVLPPSPEPSKNILRNGSRGQPANTNHSSASAFVTMAQGSAVQGSLKTLRDTDVFEQSSDKTAKDITPTNRAIRQINFDTDSNSSHSCPNESPSSFVSEAGRVLDQSIPKPVPNRQDATEPKESAVDAENQDEGNETIVLDSTQDLVLRLSPSQIVETNNNDDSCAIIGDDSPKMTDSYKTMGSHENISGIIGQSSTPNEIITNGQNLSVPSSVEREEECRRSVSQNTGLGESPESSGGQTIIVKTRTTFYDPDVNETFELYCQKNVPISQKALLLGSSVDRIKLGLYDNMEITKHADLSGSSHESGSAGSSAYHGDVSSSYNYRTSLMSTVEAGHLLGSTVRDAFVLEGTFNDSEFAVPTHPVRGRIRSSSIGSAPIGSRPLFTPGASTSGEEESMTRVKEKNGKTGGLGGPALRPNRRKRVKMPDNIDETGATSAQAQDGTPRKRRRKARTPKKHETNGIDEEEPQDAGDQQQGRKQQQQAAQEQQAGQSSKDNPLPESKKSADELIDEVAGDIKKLLVRDLEIGDRVFAPWYDKKFYAGYISGRDESKEDRWVVTFFLDNNSREVYRDQIVNLAVLPLGQSLLVLDGGAKAKGHAHSAIVISHRNVNNEVAYIVEIDGGETRQVNKESIVMTEDQVQAFHEKAQLPRLFSPETFSVSLDNIVTGKRRRRVPSSLASPRTPRTPRTATEDSGLPQTPPSSRTGSFKRRPRGKRDPILETSTLTESTGTSMSNSMSDLRSRIIQRLQMDAPRRGSAVGELEHPESDQGGDDAEKGPLPSSQIFRGHVFILTRATRPLDVNPEEISDEILHFLEMPTFHKEHLRRQLEAGGGEVLDRFDDAQLCLDEKVIVIANRPCRTERYVRSLAAGFPIVLHQWVNDCCAANSLAPVKDYLLPAGFTLDGELVEQPKTSRPLAGLRVLVANTQKAFLDLWQPILVQAECVVTFRLPARKDDESHDSSVKTLYAAVDYIVTNQACPAKVIEQARLHEIPMVSTEWVIQCLVMGEKLDPNSRDEFKIRLE